MSADEQPGDVVIAEAYDPVDGRMTKGGWYCVFAHREYIVIAHGPMTVFVPGGTEPDRWVRMPPAAFWTLVAKLEAAGCRP